MGDLEAATRPWQQSSLGDRRSVVGSVVVLAIVAMFVLLVPFVDDRVEQSGGLDEAGRFIVDDYTAIKLADGWGLSEQSELFTIISDGTYQLILIPANAEDTAPVDALGTFRETYASDPANTVTAIETFTTDAGGDAAGYRAVVASDPTGNGSAFYAVSQNGRLFSPSSTGPADLDDPFYDDIEAMVRSVVITSEPRDGAV